MQQEWIPAVTTKWLAIVVRKVLCQMDVSGLLKKKNKQEADSQEDRRKELQGEVKMALLSKNCI